MIIRAPRPSARFTQIRNDVLRDERLSYRARGILSCLLSYPDDWRTDSVEIARRGTEGREAVRTALRELEEVGYLIRDRMKVPQKHGFIWRPVVYVYDTPEAAAEAAADRDLRRAAPPVDEPTTTEEADTDPGDGFLGARLPGAPAPRAPEKAAAYKDCSPNTEDEHENRARLAESDQPLDGAAASDRTRAEPAAPVRRESVAGQPAAGTATPGEGTLFEPTSSPADAGVAPPDSGGPPRRPDADVAAVVNHLARAVARHMDRAVKTDAWERPIGLLLRRGPTEWLTPEPVPVETVLALIDWIFGAGAVRDSRGFCWADQVRSGEALRRHWVKIHLVAQSGPQLTPVAGRREDPMVQAERETDELIEAYKAGEITPEKLFPKQARQAKEAAERAARRSA